MKNKTLRFSLLFFLNVVILSLLLFAVSKNFLLLSTQIKNPLVGSIPILAGISVFYIFDSVRKLLNLHQGNSHEEFQKVFRFCTHRCVSTFVLATLTLLVPTFIH
ncbi:hypothetical protein KBD71_04045 [Candidatus Woesebacteria bacterium]|nr:hypothetical protein [Candidatus Woesebacteria bacterium]